MVDELERFVATPIREGRRGRRVHPVRIVLLVAAACAVAFLLGPTFDELAYHFSQRPCVDVGEALAADLAALPDGSCVRIDVVLGNKAAELPAYRPGSLRFGPIVVREAVGAPLFVEYAPRTNAGLGAFVQRTVEGRLVTFDGGELPDVVAYFRDELGVHVPARARLLVVGEKPGAMQLYVLVWVAALGLVITSALSVVRGARLRVIDEDGDDGAPLSS